MRAAGGGGGGCAALTSAGGGPPLPADAPPPPLGSLIYSTEKSLLEHKAKLDAALVTEVETAIKEAKEAMGAEGGDAETLKAKVQGLQTASMKIGSAIYSKSQAQGGAAAEGSEAPKEGEPVVDTTKADEGKEKK